MTASNPERLRRQLARTMRIDLDPRDVVELHAVHKRPPASDSFVARRRDPGESKSGFDIFLESVYDAVVITDLKGRIVDLNARAVVFFQSAREQMLGTQVLQLIQGADESLLDSITRNLLDHRYTLIEARCIRFSGDGFPAEIAVNRLDLEGEHRLCFFVRDITVRKQALQALEEAVARLESYDKARSEFVSNVSHELRTPLTSMIYAVHNMQKGVVGPLPERAVRYLERLDADCRRLLNTVNDILDLRQIENQTLTLVRKRIPLSCLVADCVSSMCLQAEEKNVRLSFSAPPTTAFVICDPQKMERVVLNLIGNAIKFTPSGGYIEVVLERDDGASPAGVVLSVCDTGIGIPPEAISKVTVRYFKVGEQPIGSGLGLAIAKEIVDLHGGRLYLKSPVPGTERGTAVYVRLPLAEPPSVLLACSGDRLRKRLAEALRRRGYRVEAVSSGEEASRKAASGAGDVDALLLDLSLPDVDTFQIFLNLKQQKRTARMGLVALVSPEVSAPRREMLSGFGIPKVNKPWRNADVANALGQAFYGRSAFGRPNTACGKGTVSNKITAHSNRPHGE